MKSIVAVCGLLVIGSALAAAPQADSAANAGKDMHRYIIERSFAPGVLAGLDEAGARKIGQVNAKFGVHWVMSYANAEKTRTFCLYEGPSESAIRASARANNIPVDSITEVPVTLLPPVSASAK